MGTVAAPSLIDRISNCPAKSYHAKRLPRSGFVHIGFALPIRRLNPLLDTIVGPETALAQLTDRKETDRS
jgi:hypothetical protein